MKSTIEILSPKNNIKQFSLELFYILSVKRIPLNQSFPAPNAKFIFWLPGFYSAKSKVNLKAKFLPQFVRRVTFRTRRTFPFLQNISNQSVIAEN